MMYTIETIARSLGAKALGDLSIEIDSVAEPQDAGPRALALAMKPAFAEKLAEGSALAAVLWEGADYEALGLKAAIIPPRPRYALSGLSRQFDQGEGFSEGIHPSAVIDPSAQLGEGVSVGPLAVIGAGAQIGAGSVVGPQAFIGTNALVGEGCFIREGVRIGARTTLGARVIVQPGAVIGGDGFSFVTPEESAVERTRASLGDQGEGESQHWERIHSLGAVHIGDDCEIGANACIDRGTVRDTRIGARTKLDNLVHIGHNVVIGTDCLICGQVGMAGSSTIGNNCVFAGQVGLNDNIFVGDNVIAGGATKIFTNVPKGRVLLGYPAVKMETHVETYKAMRRLPRLMKQVAELQKAVFKNDKSD
ncbi:UDP-3-O-(3-hydroxymyristoyl)glucosamine N-acyltransferase [Lentibacter sp. XHP0401]|jgi:UDP-3-O-[3-hydroxymyristoyl] glucosamine N-acyltransferase|uniref:UDP-3-O-(3-hydroxymyristoyl)glucosamine N-acyltransferase n=1 Tax=Lentibacter sp. XHP0401 TaxID=2984334 RepID=UPI0021E87E85|nr:UDP-3-O-(3-hydroxymyristoyl)glucosamine N-acyltransferase [Lentibacter sp. XHP0401]MCV2892385.1 UDP-3-O-(3-hydroxymyristoyl)glucosamine N-acyltransferase [Lentibacter sp. XHP0401]